jgi:hypothetical protein
MSPYLAIISKGVEVLGLLGRVNDAYQWHILASCMFLEKRGGRDGE